MVEAVCFESQGVVLVTRSEGSSYHKDVRTSDVQFQ
jgi:hypothetical protein